MFVAAERSLSTHRKRLFTSVGTRKSRPTCLRLVVSPPRGGSPILMPALVVVFPSIIAGLGSSVMGLSVILIMESPAKGEI